MSESTSSEDVKKGKAIDRLIRGTDTPAEEKEEERQAAKE
jgi:hypothetical protein